MSQRTEKGRSNYAQTLKKRRFRGFGNTVLSQPGGIPK
jgi:hypothetical protein